ncbi:hypothetical protein THIAE_02385 [Thiomicrospira aerophila AL3]|uniref:Outer membrane protein beta-barrel domain-containing protein n=1 Tax=Thiomicrospira aerophila AL3 TaxID=717772 RepID=W0DY69_9GAMM|nr:hypothetical protein [Thiomicrospira aerophila]AHF02193.1 hypothetical protein THIAE_02385 [Thiomicrospira aerophila AL3]
MKNALKNSLLASAIGLGMMATQVQADGGLGVGIGYGLLAGPTLELNYPINSYLVARGSVSSGMGLNQTNRVDDVNYRIKADGGIHRLGLNYHPFQGSFFLSAGYAINQFELTANARESGTVTVGDDTFDGTVAINGKLKWDNAPTLSLGWGHSPKQGWGALFEVGAIFTGAADVNLNGTINDNSRQQALNDALKNEERKLKDEVAKLDFLPILQLAVTYRF